MGFHGVCGSSAPISSPHSAAWPAVRANVAAVISRSSSRKRRAREWFSAAIIRRAITGLVEPRAPASLIARSFMIASGHGSDL